MVAHVIAKTLIFDKAGNLLLLRRSANDTHRPSSIVTHRIVAEYWEAGATLC